MLPGSATVPMVPCEFLTERNLLSKLGAVNKNAVKGRGKWNGFSALHLHFRSAVPSSRSGREARLWFSSDSPASWLDTGG